MPGPKRVPTSVLRMRGSDLAKQRADEIKPPVSVPVMPSDLAPTEADAWRQYVTEFGRVPGLLTVIDRGLLVALAKTTAELRDCETKMGELGRYCVVRNAQGIVQREVIAPWTARRDLLVAQLCRMLAECGATPASRSKVSAREDDQQSDKLDPLAALQAQTAKRPIAGVQ